MNKLMLDHRIVFDIKDNGGSPHVFCGVNKYQNAISPNTGKPLLLYAELSTADLNIDCGEKSIPLMYSWTCDLIEEEFAYKFKNNKIEIIKYKQGVNPYFKEYQLPYSNYPNEFPRRSFSLRPLTAEEKARKESYSVDVFNLFQDLQQQNINKNLTLHQIGGSPWLIQAEEELLPVCNLCEEGMSFLACFSDENFDERGFISNRFAQVIFFFCLNCCAIAAINRRD